MHAFQSRIIMSKVEQHSLPIEAYQRYALDQRIHDNNPLASLIAQAKTRPPAVVKGSTLSVSNLSALSLTKELGSPWSCFPKLEDIDFEGLYSSEIFIKLQKKQERFSSFLSSNPQVQYKGAVPLKELFSFLKDLQDMVLLIQSRRLGLQQG